MAGRAASGRGRSAFLVVARELRRRFEEGRAGIGDDVWRRWLRRIALGFAGMFVLMTLLRFLAGQALGSGLLAWESDFLLWLGSDVPIGFSTAVFLQTLGSDFTLIILVGLTAGIAAWARRPIACLSILLAAAVPDLVGRFGWLIWSRARPDILYDGMASPGFHAFPSGQTSKTFAVYGILTLLWMRASDSTLEKAAALTLLAVIVLVVPLGRVAMGVHWPTDVLAGWVIGGAWLAVLSSRDLLPVHGRS
jgi:undecaprenyl-diphosphatase